MHDFRSINPISYKITNLNSQQVGKFAEYFAKMEMTLHGFDVYTSEVDDKGIDFIVRKNCNEYIDIQVKSLRKPGYVFMPKSKFIPRNNLFLILVTLLDGNPPQMFIIPSSCWNTPDDLFVSRDYKGLKSEPEYGITVSRKNMANLMTYSFEQAIDTF